MVQAGTRLLEAVQGLFEPVLRGLTKRNTLGLPLNMVQTRTAPKVQELRK